MTEMEEVQQALDLASSGHAVWLECAITMIMISICNTCTIKKNDLQEHHVSQDLA